MVPRKKEVAPNPSLKLKLVLNRSGAAESFASSSSVPPASRASPELPVVEGGDTKKRRAAPGTGRRRKPEAVPVGEEDLVQA